MPDFLLTIPAILICMLIGVALLVVEVFMPGFGVAGVSGIALQLVAVVLAYLRSGFGLAAVILLASLALSATAVTVALRSAAKGRLSRSKVVLNSTEDGYQATEDLQVFLGREGTASSVLRPAGIADFDGVRLNVMSDGGFLDAGTRVRIVRVDGSRIIVKPVN